MKEENVLSPMFAGVMLLIAAIFIPTLIIFLNTDSSSQGIIDNAIHEFIDDARKSGKITAWDYENMMTTINHAQPLCDIHITHGKEQYLADNGIYQYHEEYGETQILDVIYTDTGENQDYLMKKGDYIHITVQNTTPTFGTKIYSLFVPKAAEAKTIAATYGGYILQNGYEY